MAHEFDGRKYEAASSHQKEWGNKLIAELQLKGSERILDLGCGNGTLTAQLAKLVPQGSVLGVDASKGMIDAALPKTQKNLSFQTLDINELEFENEFDVVFSNATLHWIDDHSRLLSSVHCALRNGGRLRFQFAGHGNCENLCSVVQNTIQLKDYKALFSDFVWPWYMPAVDEYQIIVENSELVASRIWSEPADRHFADAQAMIQWIDQPSLVPFVAHLSGALKTAFRNHVVQKMIERTKQADGRCFETFRRINVSAKKCD